MAEVVNNGKCRDCYNEYMRKYVKERYHRLRAEWIVKLGGKCASCGSVEELNFDHINASEKSYDIGRILSSHSKQKVAEEMAKCQLLCVSCHVSKSQLSGDVRFVSHGGGKTGKRNCRCDLCRPLKNEYQKRYK